ncbi:MAG: DUF3592 domain-containing protein [Labrys sp. (in: a-proteobacteria)]
MQVRANGKPIRRPPDVGILVPETVGPDPWNLVLDAGKGLRLEVRSRDDGGFDIAYAEAQKRFVGKSVDRDAALAILRSFAAREPTWREIGSWTPERPVSKQRRPQTPRQVRRIGSNRMKREERHATIAGFIVLGGAAFFAILQIMGVKFYVRDITLPEPFNSVGAKVLLAGFLFFWFFFAIAAVYKLFEVRRARSWKRTLGVIVSSEVGIDKSMPVGGVEDSRRVPKLVYEFKAGNRTFRGTRVSLAERPSVITREELQRHYPVGKSVTVYYDPSEPEESVLDRDLPAGAAKGCLIATLVVVPVLLIGMYLISAGPEWVRAVLPESQPHVFLFAALGALVSGLYAWREHVRRGQARHWPHVEGVVISSEIEQRGRVNAARAFFPVVTYKYTVGAETYYNNQIAIGVERGGSMNFAERIRASYPTGAGVKVHFDPDDPQDSALEWNETVPKVAAIVSAVLAAVALWAAY